MQTPSKLSSHGSPVTTPNLNAHQIMIATDLEPDDLLALMIVFRTLTQSYVKHNHTEYPVKLIVVGEGEAPIKQLRMQKYLELFKQHGLLPPSVNIPVVEGTSTRRVFLRDGQDLCSAKEIKQARETQAYPVAEQAITRFLTRAKQPFILQLKPVRDILAVYVKQPSLLKMATLAGYMSFNVRDTLNTMLNGKTITHEVINDFLAQFKQVFFYESFWATGRNSSLDVTTAPEVINYLARSNSTLIKQFQTLLGDWNNHILVDWLQDTLQDSPALTPELSPLIEKIKTYIEAHPRTALPEPLCQQLALLAQHPKLHGYVPFETMAKVARGITSQFVRADWGLAILLSDPKRFQQVFKPKHIAMGPVKTSPDAPPKYFFNLQEPIMPRKYETKAILNSHANAVLQQQGVTTTALQAKTPVKDVPLAYPKQAWPGPFAACAWQVADQNQALIEALQAIEKVELEAKATSSTKVKPKI